MMPSCFTFTQHLSKRLLRFISKSSDCYYISPLRTVQCLQTFSSTSKQKTKRVCPSTIALPPYVISGQLNSPSVAEIKTDAQISQMSSACKLAASILREVEESVKVIYFGRSTIKVGITTNDIDDLVFTKCIEAGAYPSPLLYKGFPKSVCTSVNEVACHGIPSEQVLNDGDIVNVDITVFYNDYHGDTSATFSVGKVDDRSKALTLAAYDCLKAGISICQDGTPFSDIGDIIFQTACEAGFEVIPFFCGHGIGTYFHGPPDIVHVPSDYVGAETMKAGMTFTIEPILCDGQPEVKILDDGWTVVTIDGSRTAQFEHTIVVTETGSRILTK